MLLQSLTVRRWIARHAGFDPERLIKVLAAVVELAHARSREPDLPELSVDLDEDPSS
jgi:hypothetical protein